MKEFAEDNFKFDEKRWKVLLKGRKRCGKRRNCSLRAISPFPTEFSEDLYCRHVKNQGLFGKGLKYLEKYRKCWSNRINCSPFLTMFYTLSKTNHVKFLLSSVKPLNFNNLKSLQFGKDLIAFKAAFNIIVISSPLADQNQDPLEY